MKISALFFCLLAATAEVMPAQVVSFGVKGGIPMLDGATSADESTRYLVGVSAEFRLPSNWAVETDALYRRVGSSRLNTFPPAYFVTTPIVTRERGNSWQFPAVLKHYFAERENKFQPFLGIGFDARTTNYIVEGTEVTGSGAAAALAPYRYTFRAETGVGTIAAAGVRMHVRRFAVIPEVRYIRWNFTDGLLKNDEADFILGISF
jgi:hypothetical protein